MKFVAVSPWQLVHAGPPEGLCSRGLGMPGREAPETCAEMASLYRLLPISQSDGDTAVMVSGAEPHLPSALWTWIVVAPASSIVKSTSLGASSSACIPTIVESANQVTCWSEPTTIAGSEYVCTLPSNAEYIGLKAIVRPPSVHEGLVSTGPDAGAGELLEH